MKVFPQSHYLTYRDSEGDSEGSCPFSLEIDSGVGLGVMKLNIFGYASKVG
jgi:hypothetical protein